MKQQGNNKRLTHHANFSPCASSKLSLSASKRPSSMREKWKLLFTNAHSFSMGEVPGMEGPTAPPSPAPAPPPPPWELKPAGAPKFNGPPLNSRSSIASCFDTCSAGRGRADRISFQICEMCLM